MRRLLPFLVVLLLAGCAAAAHANPPCSRGCNVPLGTYKWSDARGYHVQFQVVLQELKSGPHVVSVVHAIKHLDVYYATACHTASRFNSHDVLGHIDGVHGWLRYGQTSMGVHWSHDGTVTADLKHQGCATASFFPVHRAGH